MPQNEYDLVSDRGHAAPVHDACPNGDAGQRQ